MGADLYLNSVFEPNYYHYKPQFDEWVRRRDKFLRAGREGEAAAAQTQVEAYYDKLFGAGYFRDSYNATNLLWKFDLDWWGTVGEELLDETGHMQPAQAQRFLAMLSEHEATFEVSMKHLTVWEGWTYDALETYFREKYEKLKAFLKEAISRNEPIVCSI